MLSEENYTTAVHLFIRGLGLIYFFAFGAFLFQIKGLLGKEGILPIETFLASMKAGLGKKRFFWIPTLFWLNCSDKALITLVAVGTALSLLLVAGVYPPLLLFFLYFLYLSIFSTGQDFLSFGWEGYLLEITVHAFLLSLTVVPNPFVWISINFLLFRFHFFAGLVKLQSDDPSWRNLTAIAYHYLTQPIPNTVAWFAHKLPMWFQKLSCAFLFFVELVLPFAIFADETTRFFLFFGFMSLQFMIWVTGNFSFLNHLTAVFCLILLSNNYLPFEIGTQEKTPIFLDLSLSLLGIFLIILQGIRAITQFYYHPFLNKILYYISPFHLASRYGIFAVMTVKRYEVIVEGSFDGESWQEYTLYWKPSEIERRPRRISPYQPRLDWQMWFLPFDNFSEQYWFHNFLYRLLQGSKPVLSLLRHNPFVEKPPRYIRAQLYDYTYSDFKSSTWWKRNLIGPYSPILSIKVKKE